MAKGKTKDDLDLDDNNGKPYMASADFARPDGSYETIHLVVRWIEREEAAKVALDSKIDLFKRASDWQAPLNWEN